MGSRDRKWVFSLKGMHYMSIPPPNWTRGEIQVGIICTIVILLLAIFWYVNGLSNWYKLYHIIALLCSSPPCRDRSRKGPFRDFSVRNTVCEYPNVWRESVWNGKSYFPPSNQNELKENGEIIPDEELKILIQNEIDLRESMVHRVWLIWYESYSTSCFH